MIDIVMTIKSLISVAVDRFPRLENIYLGNEWPPHAHADHAGLDADDHIQYLTLTAGAGRALTGDLYTEGDLRGVVDLRLDDTHRDTHTTSGGDWSSDGIDLSASAGEWQAAYDLFGEERSLLGMITGIATLVSGVTTLNTLDGDLVVQGSAYIDVSTSDPNITISLLSHATTHQNGGSDQINVGGLPGRLADVQYAGWFNSTSYPIAATAPTSGQSLVWSGSAWAPATVSTSITGLTPQQLLYGSAGGTIAQSAAMVWDATTLLVDGNLDLNAHYVDNVRYIDFIDDSVTAAAQRMWWDGDNGCIHVGMIGGTAELSVGLEMYAPRAKNTTGAPVANGTAVYMSGAVAGVPDIQIADISAGIDACVYGIATEDITTGGLGFSTTDGIVRGVDTDAGGFSAGDPVWCASAGGYATEQPTAPNASIHLGRVVDVSATVGSIYADIHKIPYLSYLSDVHARAQAHTEGDALAWDATNLRWDLSTMVSAMVHDTITRAGVVNWYAGSGILIDSAADGFILSALVGNIIYTADSVTLVTGTEISGSVTDTETVNLVGYVIQEETGIPGADVAFEFVSVGPFDRIQAHVLYQVNPTSHTYSVQMYNYVTTAWDEFETFTYSEGYQTLDIPVEDSADYFDGSGNARLRFYHATSGNTSHQTVFDYIALVKKGGASGGGTLDQAYDYGGAGLGRSVEADSGAVAFTVPTGAYNPALALTNLESTNVADLVQLYNDGSGYTMYLTGDVGLGNLSLGHRIYSNGSCTLITDDVASGYTDGAIRSLVSLQYDYTYVATQVETRAILEAAAGAGSAYDKKAGISAQAYTSTISDQNQASLYLYSDQQMTLTSDNGVISLNPGTYVSITNSSIRGVQYLSHAINSGASFSGSTLTLDLLNGYGIMEVDLTADCTAVTVSSDPVGYVEMVLFVTASGGIRSLAGFPAAWKWQGNYNLSDDSTGIASGTTAVIRIWRLSTGGYRAQFVHEVEA